MLEHNLTKMDGNIKKRPHSTLLSPGSEPEDVMSKMSKTQRRKKNHNPKINSFGVAENIKYIS